MLDSLQSLFESPIPGVTSLISPAEQMSFGKTDYYLSVGQSALRLVKLALLHSLKRPDAIRHILDLPCGHGRVLRTLRAAFPDAHITASDLLADGVNFCAKNFNALPILSQINPTPDLFPHAGHYDLIFVGSLFTHLDADRWAEFLSLFHTLLAPDGILLFTTHGPYVEYRLQSGETYGYGPQHAPAPPPAPPPPPPLTLPQRARRKYRKLFLSLPPVPAGPPPEPDFAPPSANPAIRHIINSYHRTGFGYLDDGTGYGISLSTPGWTLQQLAPFADLRTLFYCERAWDNHQDAVAVIKKPFLSPVVRVGHPFLDPPQGPATASQTAAGSAHPNTPPQTPPAP